MSSFMMPAGAYGQAVRTRTMRSRSLPHQPYVPQMGTHHRPYMAQQTKPTSQPFSETGQPFPREDASPKSEYVGPDVKIWVKEARDFKLNADFDFSHALPRNRKLSLEELYTIMKTASAEKRTIQALADKLMLHRLLDNLGVPQLPHLMEVDGTMSIEEVRRAVTECIDKFLSDPHSPPIFFKPSHLCNGAGACTLLPFDENSKCKVHPWTCSMRDCTVDYLVDHIHNFMGKKAGKEESIALQSINPGFIVQPQYQSVVRFKLTLELRVMALWGKVREAVWWWGPHDTSTLSAARNVWIVRRPKKADQLSDEDDWEFLHNHKGHNIGWDRAVELFLRHMPAMSKTTEFLATAVGSPWLRADFFVGDISLGVRLNEVAYGCGCSYRWKPIDGSQRMVDDAPAIAQILQEGMKVCQKVSTPHEFLSRLGAEGSTYTEMIVSPLSAPARRIMQQKYPANALQEGSDENAKDCAASEDLCRTIKSSDGTQILQAGRSPPSPPYRSVTHDLMMKPMPGTAHRGYPAKVLNPVMMSIGGHRSAGPQMLQGQPSYVPQAFQIPLVC
eukprot:gnl/TRDRNA2_/TRDRNA2_167896_c1_seq13.p1 gnl/TRDRNA2_/TRDRNA2_167896_c1~~gnl/TRDRNA2_/TRDRNA2_167896_c1_seq13.p1  ORF type:complete len:559 (-),score=57.18 gnl/TRDRNA2_/TRDRNA2_167896_c1_seq13:28-1704(-)